MGTSVFGHYFGVKMFKTGWRRAPYNAEVLITHRNLLLPRSIGASQTANAFRQASSDPKQLQKKASS
jgi:hypothetical protein